jgi:bifunctional non-homologous end joining protein LigD
VLPHVEHDGKDMRDRIFLDRKPALAWLLRNTEASILFNEHIAEDGPIVFAHACRLSTEGIVSKKVNSTYRSGLRSPGDYAASLRFLHCNPR